MSDRHYVYPQGKLQQPSLLRKLREVFMHATLLEQTKIGTVRCDMQNCARRDASNWAVS
jgi:hypothetical protein